MFITKRVWCKRIVRYDNTQTFLMFTCFKTKGVKTSEKLDNQTWDIVNLECRYILLMKFMSQEKRYNKNGFVFIRLIKSRTIVYIILENFLLKILVMTLTLTLSICLLYFRYLSRNKLTSIPVETLTACPHLIFL